jgi:hypothetical protein
LKLKVILALLLWSCIVSNAWSQHDWNWATADSVIIRFPNGGNPEFDSTQKSASFVESGACYSDENGELVYFANHRTVFNGNSGALQNGNYTNSFSLYSITQGILAIPSPVKKGELIQFYLTDDCQGPTLCPAFLEVDPAGSQGQGQVKNVTIMGYPGTFGRVTEKLTATPHADGKSWWILVHDRGNADFYEYFVNTIGVFPPIKRSVGASHSSVSSATVGEMNFSPDGTKLLVVSMSGIVDLFDFNRCTGEITNWQNLGTPALSTRGPHTYYGCSFSPDGTKAYVSEIWNDTTGNRVFQYDLTSPDIFASKTLVFQAPPFVLLAQHQIGPNGRIYIAHINEQNLQDSSNFFLSEIENPNQLGSSCNLNYLSFSLNGRRSRGGLPNLPNYNLGPLHAQTAEGGPSHLICPGDSIQLGLPDTTGGLVSYTWTPANSLSDRNSPQPWAMPNATTMYYLKVVDSTFGLSCGVTRDSVLVRVATAQEMPQANAGADTVICPGGSAIIGGSDSAVTGWIYSWTPSMTVDDPASHVTSTSVGGLHLLTVSNPISQKACFIDRDTVQIEVYNPFVVPQELAGRDSIICKGDTLQLGVANAPGGWLYQWSPATGLNDPNLASPLAAPDLPTTYRISAWDSSVSIPCAMAEDSVAISVEQPLSHESPPSDITFCPGECFTIGVAPQPNLIYTWSSSSGGSSTATGLDNPQSSLTRARPGGTTLYTLSIIDPNRQSANCREITFPVTATADNCNFPTFLWPNGDGIAETLDFGEYDAVLALDVFDVQGRLVFRSVDYRNDWDGGGIGAGVYLYRLTIQGPCGFLRTGKFVRF